MASDRLPSKYAARCGRHWLRRPCAANHSFSPERVSPNVEWRQASMGFARCARIFPSQGPTRSGMTFPIKYLSGDLMVPMVAFDGVHGPERRL
jgi:hypothetical protein